jgi:hypothetical protein
MKTPNPMLDLFILQAFSVSPVPALKTAHPPSFLSFESVSLDSPAEIPLFVYTASATKAANQKI